VHHFRRELQVSARNRVEVAAVPVGKSARRGSVNSDATMWHRARRFVHSHFSPATLVTWRGLSARLIGGSDNTRMHAQQVCRRRRRADGGERPRDEGSAARRHKCAKFAFWGFGAQRCCASCSFLCWERRFCGVPCPVVGDKPG
jgi:hypothetical protein